jgi:acetoin utilization deacetylase AcuC-like enzyme
MHVVFDDRQFGHEPQSHFYGGKLQAAPEKSARAQTLLQAALANGLERIAAMDHGLQPIAAVHDAAYLEFLAHAHEAWAEDPQRSAEVIAHVHPVRYGRGKPRSILGAAGYFTNGTNCPIGPRTYGAAYWSAQTALTAADLLLGGERCAYALCRPPGHHAHADLAAGFCFLNNVAIAAQSLLANRSRAPGPIGVIDVDVHHGNGTQEIFWGSGEVFCGSVHADPAGCYPFYQGYADERGEGEGEGWNMNLPLARGSGDAEMLAAVDTLCGEALRKGCRTLVVALGFDAHEDDPLGQLRVSDAGFARIAARIRSTGLPVLLVQEGGYDGDALGRSLSAFLEAFRDNDLETKDPT